jgi:hypothetical protein
MKKYFLQILFLSIFGLALLSVPVYWISLGGKFPENSKIEGRHLSTFPSLSYKNFKIAIKYVLRGKTKEAGDAFFNQFIDRSFQTKFEVATADQFPARITAIQIAKGLERGMIRLAYLFLSDPAIPADTQSNLYVMRDSSRLIYGVKLFTPAVKAMIDTRVQNYTELIQLYPKQKFYVFYFQRLFDSPYHPLINYFNNVDSGQSFQYFKDNKPQKLILGDLLFSGIDDHINYFFNTDHHWNIRGACRAYLEIYKMLAIGYPAISPAMKCDEFITVPDVMFLGSLARETLYPIQPEKFEISDVSLPPYRKIIDRNVTYYTAGPQQLIKNLSHNPYTGLYVKFYGLHVPLKEYIFDNRSQRNAMIIGDSFVNSIEPYLASHYNHTYFVDFRGYEHFSLGEFLKEYHVDDIIIIGDNDVALTDLSWMINP